MVEREQARGRQDGDAEVDDSVVPSEGPVGVKATSGDEEKARNAAFLAALDKVMEDHRHVLAALAK